METPCAHCKEKTYLRHTEYGTLVCTECGVEDFSFVLSCHRLQPLLRPLALGGDVHTHQAVPEVPATC